jgi:hypothetical protein
MRGFVLVGIKRARTYCDIIGVMNRKNKVAIGFIIFVFVTIFFYTDTYTSSPGFTTQEHADEFFESVPTCYGISILLNEEETWVDNAGRSLCIGYLSK